MAGESPAYEAGSARLFGSAVPRLYSLLFKNRFAKTDVRNSMRAFCDELSLAFLRFGLIEESGCMGLRI